jgi:hypothetical protein
MHGLDDLGLELEELLRVFRANEKVVGLHATTVPLQESSLELGEKGRNFRLKWRRADDVPLFIHEIVEGFVEATILVRSTGSAGAARAGRELLSCHGSSFTSTSRPEASGRTLGLPGYR